jgi:Fe2+ transport system protein FeoA
LQLTEEQAHQVAVVKWLRQRGVLHLHVANEGNVPPQYRAKLIAMGLLPGASDLLVFLPGGKLAALEMKAPGGTATQAQRQFIDRVIQWGGVGTVAKGKEEAIKWLESQLK